MEINVAWNWKEISNNLLDIKYYISDVLWDKLIRNPYFLGAVGLFFLFSVFKRWKSTAIIIFSIASITCVTHFLLPEKTGFSHLFPFVGAIILAGGVAIYFLFVKD